MGRAIVVRSTKAGAAAPATLACTSRLRQTDGTSLNEGRGRSPGDTMEAESAIPSDATAQRRPGPQPRRHSRRPPSRPGRPWDTLNEGRGRSPGDTSAARNSHPSSLSTAQRRPGPQPRRHPLEEPEAPAHVVERSTKAGAAAPATQDGGGVADGGPPVAQRRPGPQPRRHLNISGAFAASFPAQRRPGPQPRRHASSV